MRTRPLDFVLCHSDIHVGNVLARDDGHISIVDWDQPLIAPKERDLMFIVGSAGAVAVSAENQAQFLRGYGTTEIDPVAFAYYRYDWVAQDAKEYGAMGFGLRDGSDDTRRDALLWMRRILGPNDALGAADKTAI
jgi:spectinomycin phosphotransferase